MTRDHERAPLPRKTNQNLGHGSSPRVIQVCTRLVEEEQRRIAQERAGESDSLTLPPRQSAGAGSGKMPNRESLEEVVGSPNVLCAHAVRDGREEDVFSHGHGIDELVILEDESDLVAADLRALNISEPRRRLAVDENLAARRREHCSEESQQRGLAAPTRAAQDNELASGHDERHSVDDRPTPTPIAHSLRQISRFDRERSTQGEIHATRRTLANTIGQGQRVVSNELAFCTALAYRP
jgi:hypothetical protein